MRKPLIIIFTFLLLLIITTAHAELKNNMPADVVVGQANFTSSSANPGGRGANTLSNSYGVFSDGKRLFIADWGNHRVLIYNSIPTSNNASADVVIGQANFTSGTANPGGRGANTFSGPAYVFSDGKRLFIADNGNHRLLIYNSIPTSNNASADVVIGQANFTSGTANQGGSVGANTLSRPVDVACDGRRLFVTDDFNHRILIYNSIPTANNASADVVVGQPNFTSNSANQGGSPGANTINDPFGVFSDGTRLFISDKGNNRLLIYNTIPTTNNASADVVVGQPNFTSNSANQGGSVGANTQKAPHPPYYDGKRLFIPDHTNGRLLIYNSIPTANNASADIVIGQPNFTSGSANQGGSVGANTLYLTRAVVHDGKRLFIGDGNNNRVLIYNIGGSSIELGPQFEQGKAVLGKVFEDKNGNGIQDEGEQGLEGIKVASDTGTYAITDSDGKYHFPYIETGQRLLKIDLVTLPEGSKLTTDNPYKVTVTKGILTKVSFGVKLLQEAQLKDRSEDGPLFKVSITHDPVLLKPRLAVSTTQDKDNLIFSIDCNYFLFLEKAKLSLYDSNYKLLKYIDLAKPLPARYILPISELPDTKTTYYYQLCVYDRQNKEDRTGIGSFKVK